MYPVHTHQRQGPYATYHYSNSKDHKRCIHLTQIIKTINPVCKCLEALSIDVYQYIHIYGSSKKYINRYHKTQETGIKWPKTIASNNNNQNQQH